MNILDWLLFAAVFILSLILFHRWHARRWWIAEVARLLAEKHGDKEPNESLKGWAHNMASYYYDDWECRCPPEEAVDEEIYRGS